MTLEEKNARAVADLEKRLRGIYREAYKEMNQKSADYWQELQNRKRRELTKFMQGSAYGAKSFASWWKTQEQRGKRYQKMRDDVLDNIVNANQIASQIINGTTPSAYALNANYTAYEIEKGLKNANFELVDQQAIVETLKQNVSEFRTVNPNPVRDYSWNKTQIDNAIISGILQGKSIDELAGSFLTVMQRNENSAYRNARTAMTSACNAGVLSTMKKGEQMGINVQKRWLSTSDARTRDSHVFLNGQIRPINKAFDNGLMFPCDSKGRPEEVYNCRCRITYILPEYEDVKSNEAYADDKRKGENYKEWVKRKQREAVQASAGATAKTMAKEYISDFVPAKTKAEALAYAQKFADVVNFDGITLDNINLINQELDLLFGRYPINKLEYLGKGQKRSSAVMSANFRHLNIYGRKLGKPLYESAKMFEAEKQSALRSIENIKQHFAGKKIPAELEKSIKRMQDLQNYARYSVLDSYEENPVAVCVIHEYGHVLSDQYFGMINGGYANPNIIKNWSIKGVTEEWKNAYSKALANGDIYKISKYGATKASEFFAESFAMYEMGEPLPDYIKELMDEVIKNGIMQ